MAVEKALVKSVCTGVLPQADQGAVCQFGHGAPAGGHVAVGRAAHRYLGKAQQLGLLQGAAGGQRRGDDGKVALPVPQPLDGLGGGLVGDAQVHPRVLRPENGQLVQQDHMQGRLAGADGQRPALQAAVPADLLLAQLQLLHRRRHPPVEPLALGRQGDALVGAVEQLAPQLLLQVFHAAGDVGLVVLQQLGRPCKTAALGHHIKNTVIIVVDGHRKFSLYFMNYALSAIQKLYCKHINKIFYNLPYQ